MTLQKTCTAALVCLLVISGCASSPPAESGSSRLDRARSANAASQADMEQGSGGRSSSKTSPKPNVTKDKAGKPSWVDNADSVYDKTYYIAETGRGRDQRQAEAAALSALTGLFGRSVSGDFKAVEGYKRRVANGSVDVSSSTDIEEAFQVSSSMESLIGAEIDDVWYDEANKTYHAVAVMDKAKTIPIYKSIIDVNAGLVNRLTNLPAGQSVTVETIAGYYLAASIADANAVFVTVLSMLGGPDMRSSLGISADYIKTAKDLAKQIPVNVAVKVALPNANTAVENDTINRIRSALAGVLSGEGFNTGVNDSRYKIDATLSITPVDLPNQPNKFSRFVLTAEFTDTNTKAAPFLFNINGREGHVSQTEADQRAIRRAEARIKEEYGQVLRDYLSGGLSQD